MPGARRNGWQSATHREGIRAMELRHPEIEVQLSGVNGNAFVILGIVKRALRDAGVPLAEQNLYLDEATSGDDDHLLRTTVQWVNVA